MAVASARVTASTVALSNFTVARYLYYGGVLTIGEPNLRPVLDLTVSDLFFFASLLTLACAWLLDRRPLDIRIPPLVVAGTAVFAVGGVASSLVSAHSFESFGDLSRVIYITIVWFALSTVILQTEDHVRDATRLWVLSVCVTALAALVQLYGLQRGVGVPGTFDIYGNRMTGFTEHPNTLGSMCALVLVPALGILAVRARTVPAWIVGHAVVGALLAGLVVSGSIGALAAAVAALVAWTPWAWRAPRARLTFALLTLAVAVGAYGGGLLDSEVERIGSVTAPGSSAATGPNRLLLDQRAISIIEQSPLYGAGLDGPSNYETMGGGYEITGGGVAVHNMLLFVGVGGGVLAMIGMVMILSSVLALGFRMLVRSLRDPRKSLGLPAILVASYVAFLVYGVSAPILYIRYGWLPVALLVALRAIQGRAQGRRAV
jgi:O-antigen ligase